MSYQIEGVKSWYYQLFAKLRSTVKLILIKRLRVFAFVEIYFIHNFLGYRKHHDDLSSVAGKVAG